jgi:hypothetical protein
MLIKPRCATALVTAVLLVSCTEPSVHVRTVASLPPLAEACCLKLYDAKDPVPPDAKLIAEIDLRETGFTVNCSREQQLERVRRRACRLGADAVRAVESHLPMGTCTDVHAELYWLPERPQPAHPQNPALLDGTALCGDRFALRPRDEKGAAPRRKTDIPREATR